MTVNQTDAIANEPVEIGPNAPLSVIDDIGEPILLACGESALGFGLTPDKIDWERFWVTLENYGFDMQDLGGKVHDKIQRIVRKMKADGRITW